MPGPSDDTLRRRGAAPRLSKGRKKRTLRQWRMERRMAECKVCRLPDDVRHQLGVSRQNTPITVGEALQWIRDEYGITITAADYKQHAQARHEYRRQNPNWK